MSGTSTKKFAREVMKKAGADQMTLIRKNKHQILEFRRKGIEKGVIYTLPVSASCNLAIRNAAKEIERKFAELFKEQQAGMAA